MNKKGIVFLLCMVLLLAGCSSMETDAGKSTEESVATESAETNRPEPGHAAANDTRVYRGSDEVTEIGMGTYVDGVRTVLCRVKLPVNYYFGSMYRDEAGQLQTMHEVTGKLLSEVVASGALESGGEVPEIVEIVAPGDVANSYTFVIVDSQTISVETEKAFEPAGIEIAAESAHEAYIYSTSGQFDVIMAYQIDENWTLLIENSGQLPDEMSLEEIGQEFYNLVTPVN